MKKMILIIARILFLVIIGCNLSQSQHEKPGKVHRIVYEIYPEEWYTKQAELWKKETEKDPKNAEAWHNYYNAVRYARFVETIDTPNKQAALNKIIEDMEKNIPDSYEYYLLKFKTNSDLSKINLIEKAHQLKPDAPEPYYDLITYHEINGNNNEVDEFYKKLYNSKDIAPWLIDYNYNVLMSAEKDAILITNGDNDTYPAIMLQRVHHVRNDVTIMNITLSAVDSYAKNKLAEKGIDIDVTTLRQKAFSETAGGQKQLDHAIHIQELIKTLTKNNPEIPICFALTVYENYIKPFKEDLYIVGLAYRYSKTRIDNVALLKKNIANFRLDYVNFNWYAEDLTGKRLMAQMNLNYVAPAIMLAEHCAAGDEIKLSNQWKEFALQIARNAGRQEIVDDINSKKF